MELIYLDNAATTRTDERVVEAMLPYFTQYYGNASTIYALGEESRKAVTRARDIIAAGIGAKKKENISSPVRLSIMQFFIPVNGWKDRALR